MSRAPMALSLFLLVGCAPEQPCDPIDIDVLVKYCWTTFRFEFEPRQPVCRDAGVAVPMYWSPDLRAACDATGSAQFIECAARKCLEGKPEEISNECRKDPEVVSSRLEMSCIAKCEEREAACAHNCPRTDWGACSSCEAPCETERSLCERRCKETRGASLQ